MILSQTAHALRDYVVETIGDKNAVLIGDDTGAASGLPLPHAVTERPVDGRSPPPGPACTAAGQPLPLRHAPPTPSRVALTTLRTDYPRERTGKL